MKNVWLSTLLLVGVGLCAGCGPTEAEVSGTVLMDDQPLKEGDIIFQEADNTITPSSSKIVDGKYTLRVLPGSKVVRINASRPPLIPDKVMGDAAREPMIAEEFNTRSTLKADVKPGKHQGVDFKVKSIPR
jgi:hypothetical protein